MEFKKLVRKINTDLLEPGHLYKVWATKEDINNTLPFICVFMNGDFYAINSNKLRKIRTSVSCDDDLYYVNIEQLMKSPDDCAKIEDIIDSKKEIITNEYQFVLSNFKVGEPYLITGIDCVYGRWGLFEGANATEGTLSFAFIEGEHEVFYTGDIYSILTMEEMVNEQLHDRISLKDPEDCKCGLGELVERNSNTQNKWCCESYKAIEEAKND